MIACTFLALTLAQGVLPWSNEVAIPDLDTISGPLRVLDEPGRTIFYPIRRTTAIELATGKVLDREPHYVRFFADSGETLAYSDSQFPHMGLNLGSSGKGARLEVFYSPGWPRVLSWGVIPMPTADQLTIAGVDFSLRGKRPNWTSAGWSEPPERTDVRYSDITPLRCWSTGPGKLRLAFIDRTLQNGEGRRIARYSVHYVDIGDHKATPAGRGRQSEVERKLAAKSFDVPPLDIDVEHGRLALRWAPTDLGYYDAKSNRIFRVQPPGKPRTWSIAFLHSRVLVWSGASRGYAEAKMYELDGSTLRDIGPYNLIARNASQTRAVIYKASPSPGYYLVKPE